MDNFFTIYFKDGFESLIDIVKAVEKECIAEVGMGSNFINLYTTSYSELGKALIEIEKITYHRPEVKIDEIPFNE